MKYFFFDLGNVLVHFDAMIACRNVGRLVGRDEKEIFEGLYGSGIEVDYEHGNLTDEEFAQAFRQRLGVDCTTADLLHEMSAMFTPNHEILKVIDRLVAANVTLGILSNTCAAHWSWVQRQGCQVASGWFRDAVLSYEVGVMKPDAKIYRLATDVAGVDPGSVFFTDDRAENVEGAKQAGWQAELFRDADSLLRVISKHV